MIARLIVGFSIGIGSSIVPMYLAEIAPAKIRGFLCGFHLVVITTGLLFGQLMGIPMSTQELWRPLFCTSLPLIVVQLILLPFVPQSPKWLLLKKKDADAESALKRIRGQENVTAELNDLKKWIELHTKAVNIKLVFQKKMIRPLITGVGAMFFLQFVGINIVASYSTIIFASVGVDNPAVATSVVGAAQLFIRIVALFIVDVIGRRVLLLLSTVFMFLSFSILGIASILFENKIEQSVMGWVTIITMIMYVLAFVSCTLHC